MAVDEIEKALYSILTNDADVAALVSTRIYPLVVPQGASMPAIAYQGISSVWDFNVDGAVNLAADRIQVNCWAETYAETRTLADKVRFAMDGYSDTVGTVEIVTVFLDDEGDLFTQPGDVTALQKFAKRLDFIFWHKEAA